MELKTIGEQTVQRLRDAVAKRHAGTTPEVTIGSLARHTVVSVAPATTLRSVLHQLVGGDVGVVLVVENDAAVGIVSERDVIDALYEDADLDVVWAADITRTDVVSMPASTTAHDAAARMIDEGVRHLVVEGDPLGVVSMRDVVVSLI